MKRFNYKAKDKAGNLVVGEVEAMDMNDAAKLVRGKSLVVIAINPKLESPIAFIKHLRERITPADVASFTRQLSTMINAGLPITEALNILRSQIKGPMQTIVSQIQADVEAGDSLSSSLSKHNKIFSKTFIALIKSGEVGGVIDKVLARLADNLEKEQEFTGKVKGALIYPTVVVVGMVVVAIVMMAFVIPRLTSLYGQFNADLPLPTKVLISTSDFFAKFWFLFIIAAGLGLYILKLYRDTTVGRRKTDELIFKIPIFGELQRQVILTEITRTLALMVGSGVSILESLNITAEVVDNVVISDALRDAAKQVEKGFPVAYSFSRHPDAFPFIVSQMIAVGEETGKMDEVLTKVSHIFETDSDQRVKSLTSAIEPVIMVLLGVGVGFLVIAIILPIYNLTNQF